MSFRWRAFGTHLAGSALVLTLVLGTLYVGWYHWPGWYVTDAPLVLGLVCAVDLLIGPVLTLAVANPAKLRKVFARDVAAILTVQIVALALGASTLWRGRPLYYTFSTDRLEVVQASEISERERLLAQQQNPGLSPHWYSRPRWVWVPLPDDAASAEKIVNGVLMGGPDIIQMPRYFRPWEQGLTALRKELKPVTELQAMSGGQKEALRARLSRFGVATDKSNAITLWAAKRVVVVFDPTTMERKGSYALITGPALRKK
jgi:hypothetical protein